MMWSSEEWLFYGNLMQNFGKYSNIYHDSDEYLCIDCQSCAITLISVI